MAGHLTTVQNVIHVLWPEPIFLYRCIKKTIQLLLQ